MSNDYLNPQIEILDGDDNVVDLDIESWTFNDGHDSSSATSILDIHTNPFDIGAELKVYVGYGSAPKTKIFGGYVKQIEKKTPNNTYTVTANNYIVRASDYYFVSADQNVPFSRNNIQTEDLVRDVLAEAGLTNFTCDDTYFLLRTGAEEGIAVSLVTAYDFCKNLANILTWHLWGDEDGLIHFENRKPYVMFGTSGTPGDSTPEDADQPIGYILIDEYGIDYNYSVDEKNLRNRVVVYAGDIVAEREVESEYLPAGFRKSVLMGCTGIIDDQYHADLTARYNLAYLNRLTYGLQTTVIGNPILLPRRTLTVNSSIINDATINGDWYIFSTQHSFDKSGGYTTNMVLKR